MSFIATINITTFNIMTISKIGLIEALIINDTELKDNLKKLYSTEQFKKNAMLSITFFCLFYAQCHL